jgi:hypothetical protein
MVNHERAETNSPLGTDRSTTRRPTGTIIAPPIPWMIRNSTKSGRLTANPQAIEPAMKMTRAARNTFFAPYRSAAQPLTGMNTARLSR